MNDDIQFKTDLFTFNQTRKDFTTFEALASYLKRPDDFIKIKAFTRLTIVNQYLSTHIEAIQCKKNKGGMDDSIVQDHADKLGPQPGVFIQYSG